MNEELYQLLGVEPTASTAQIKAAYWKKAKTAHPDRGGDPEEFRQLTIAYATLSDPLLRKDYDLAGKAPEDTVGKQNYRVSVHISQMFEHFIDQLGVPGDGADVVGLMKTHILGVQAKLQGEEAKLATLLQSYNKLHKMVRRKGDGVNLFAQIAEKKILEHTEAYGQTKMAIADCQRVFDILQNHESVVDVVRTIHAQQGFASYEAVTNHFFALTKNSTN